MAGSVADRMHYRGGNDTVACLFQQVPDHGAGDAEAHRHELIDAEMVHQAELVVEEAVPRSFDFERALRLTAGGVTQIERDDAISIAEFLQRIEGMAGEIGDFRI